MSIGLRVFTKRPQASEHLLESFRQLAAAPVADCMNRLNVLSSNVRCLSPRMDKRMAGRALTVKVRPGDNLLIHKALDMAVPGDVIIVSNEGSQCGALMGEVMFSYAAFKGIEGIVLDGPVRDITCLKNIPYPVYGTGTTPRGPYKTGPGEINVPIACADVAVNPGDIVLGDDDGVIIIPLADAEKLLIKAQDFAAKDDAKVQAALHGTANRSWVNTALEELKCETIDKAWNEF